MKPNRCECGGLRHKCDIQKIAQLEVELAQLRGLEAVIVTGGKNLEALYNRIEELETEVERLQGALEQKEHFLILSLDGWSIEHLVECRPDMARCEVHQAAMRMDWENTSAKLGRYRAWVEDGILKFDALEAGGE